MRKPWNDKAWGDYPYRQTQDKKTPRRISKLMVYKVENSDTLSIVSCRGHYQQARDLMNLAI